MTRTFIAILCAILSAGCVDSDSIVVVQPDGSGTVTNTVLLKLATIELMRNFRDPGTRSTSYKEFFSEEKMRAAGRRMGEGVTFQSMQPLSKEGWEGARVIYAFTDISKLTLVTGANAVQTLTDGGGTSITFRFTPAAAGAPAKLTIVMPIKEGSEESAWLNDPSPKRDDAGDKAMMEHFKSLLEGGRDSIAVEVGGRIVKTNADSVKGSRVPLETIDLDQMMASDGDITWVASVHQGKMSLAEARRKMNRTKGVWMQLKPEVNVEFARK